MVTSSIESILPSKPLCEQEAIHIPGTIQPHGCVLVLDAESLVVIQSSVNAQDWFGDKPDRLLAKPFANLVDADTASRLRLLSARRQIGDRPIWLASARLAAGRCDVLVHRIGTCVVVEFEQLAGTEIIDLRQLYPAVNGFVQLIHRLDRVEDIGNAAAQEIKKLTGFGRVLLYRFDRNYHGHVIAEVIDDGYQSYLDQRFPASDIPAQARALYRLNPIRLIPDAGYTPVPIEPAINPMTGQPTDMSYTFLRSVSPVHARYMQNMGTAASMSLSIIVRGQLWGLLVCHHATPRHVSFELRTAAEQIAQILSLQIEAKEETREANNRLELRRILVAMLSALSTSSDFIDNLHGVAHDLLRFASASGAAIVYEGAVHRIGDAPTEEEIAELVQWLAQHVSDTTIYHTAALGKDYPASPSMCEKASGILVLPISQVHRHYLIWFRPEVTQTIKWAGNPLPDKKAAQQTPAEQLSPRHSFNTWREIVHGTSAEWRKSEIEIAAEFRTALLGMVLKRAEQMAELAGELGRANKELESFSYSVSHDLRAPLRHIVGYTDLLNEFEGDKLSDRGKRFLKNIVESARFAGKLVDDLLSFSQMGRAALRPRRIDLATLVRSCIDQLAPETQDRQIEWVIGELPSVEADPAFIQLALQNLLSNAVKYTRQRSVARVEITADEEDDAHIIYVRDNGVGFNMRYVEKLFGVFQRLHRMEEFEGTGIGLANVRRIIERHGGTVKAEGVLDQGAVFSFSLPKHPSSSNTDSHAETNHPR